MAQRASMENVRAHPRIPPHNLDAEQSVLGAMLESKEAIANVIEIVKPDDFYKPAHTTIYDTIIELYGRGERPDAITVAEELNRRGALDHIGGKPYIHGLLEAYPTASSAAYYARIVEEHALLRRLIEAGNEVANLGFSMPEDVAEAVDQAEEIVYQVGDRRLRDDVMPIRPLLTENMEAIEQLYERGEHLTGLGSGFAELDEKTLGFQPSNLIIIAARPSMGKCLESSTRLTDPATGEPVRLDEFVARRVSCVSGLGSNGDLRSTAVTDWIPNGRKECFRLVTRTGRRVTATLNHPFLTVDGWAPLAGLDRGDRIAVPRALPTFGIDDSYTPERARLLAYYIAEGGLTGGGARFTNTDPEIIEDFERAVVLEFPDCSLRRDHLTLCVRAKERSRSRNSVVQWLGSEGLMGKSALKKRFPAAAWRFNRPLMREFLKALLSCDGTIYPMGGYGRIEFTVASEGLAEDVHHALLRFGIISKMWRKTERSWRVEITEPDSVDRYQLEIGWIGEKARRRFMTSDKPRRSNAGHLPTAAWDLVKKSAKNAGISLSEMARRAGEAGPGECLNLHTKRGLPRRRLAKYAEVLNDDDLRWLASEDLYWDDIVSIEPVGERDVYDLTVPDGHNFVANDIIVHNSALMGDFALHAAVRQKSPVVIFSLEMSRNEIVQRFLSSEAKVDSQRIRKGSLQEQDWARLSNALGRLHEAPIFIDDSASVTLMEMRAKCRRLKAKHGLGLIIIDYLQLMSSPRKSENRNQEVSEISRSLKILARELEVPVVCASQLNRGVEQRADKRPLLGDLRESGCLAGETLVQLASGQQVPIRDLVGKTPDVVCLDGWNVRTGRASRVWRTGHRPVLKMRLASGREIRATDNHKFRLLDGWKPLGDISVGTRLATPRVMPPVTAPTSWDRSRIALLAHLIGDGCYASRQPLHYTSKSRANLRAVSDAALDAFGIAAREVKQETYFHLYLSANGSRWRHNPLIEWLRELGVYGQRSHEKFVPDSVFAFSADDTALFLRHLWATDGCVWMARGQKGSKARIYYSTNSEALARQVQTLLLRFGIVARLKSSSKEGYRRQFHVDVVGARDQLVFAQQIGGVGDRESALAELLPVLQGVTTNTNKDTVPKEIWSVVKDRMRSEGITQRRMAVMRGSTYGGTSHFRFAPSRRVLGQYAELLKDDSLGALANSDIYWDEVVAIEPDGTEDVFDMTVPGTHNFIANDIVVHNSIEQDADMVMFLYRDEFYNHDSEHKGEAELIVAKHRNGPTGTVNLAFMNQYTKFASIARGSPG